MVPFGRDKLGYDQSFKAEIRVCFAVIKVVNFLRVVLVVQFRINIAWFYLVFDIFVKNVPPGNHVMICWLMIGQLNAADSRIIPNGFLSSLGTGFKWRSSISRLEPLITNHFRPSRDMIMTSSRDKFCSNSSFIIRFILL